MIWGDAFLDALEPALERARREFLRRESREYRQSLELLRAVRCAPNVGVAEAMLRHERVPYSALDAKAAAAYGLAP